MSRKFAIASIFGLVALMYGAPVGALTLQAVPVDGNGQNIADPDENLMGHLSVSRSSQDGWGWGQGVDETRARGGAGFGTAEPQSDFGPNYPKFFHN